MIIGQRCAAELCRCEDDVPQLLHSVLVLRCKEKRRQRHVIVVLPVKLVVEVEALVKHHGALEGSHWEAKGMADLHEKVEHLTALLIVCLPVFNGLALAVAHLVLSEQLTRDLNSGRYRGSRSCGVGARC